jgi:hypothetical protein
MEKIRDISDYVIPLNNNDEIMLLGQMLAS